MAIPLIDLSKHNCWVLYLLPFDEKERTDYDLALELQKKCIEDNMFGMGWDVDVPGFEYGTPLTPKNVTTYCKRYTEKYSKENYKAEVSKEAIEGFKTIKKDDYVITRLKDGHFYVGRVSSDGAFYIYNSDDRVYKQFSWGGTVDKWIEYCYDGDVPSEIVGRFSQRYHKTIQRVDPYRQMMLIIAMYEKNAANKEYDIPKLRIGRSNFVRSLSYMELEDLVSFYILEKHEQEGYKLIPSSCKISEQNYEFRYVAKGRKPITCQVKNQSEIDINQYCSENSFERIYMFSGLWDNERVERLRGQMAKNKQLYIISPEELYGVLKRHIDFFANVFYDFSSEPIGADKFIFKGFSQRPTLRAKKSYTISDNKDFASFLSGDRLFYSAEFGAIVRKWSWENERDYEDSVINEIMPCFQ